MAPLPACPAGRAACARTRAGGEGGCPRAQGSDVGSRLVEGLTPPPCLAWAVGRGNSPRRCSASPAGRGSVVPELPPKDPGAGTGGLLGQRPVGAPRPLQRPSLPRRRPFALEAVLSGEDFNVTRQRFQCFPARVPGAYSWLCEYVLFSKKQAFVPSMRNMGPDPLRPEVAAGAFL